VCGRLREHLPAQDAEQAERFVRRYYRWVSPDDIAERDELDVYGAALSHFNFAREREPGTTKVRVFNPEFETHGWKSTHTAVEIVTDDMPFLIDSVTMELNRRGFGVHVIIHPVMAVRRDEAGRLVEVLGPEETPDGGFALESVIHAEVDRQTDPVQLELLTGHLQRVIGEVRAAVDDWRPMRERALELATELRESPPPLDPVDVDEVAAFLEWLSADHFTFLGYREYDLLEEAGDTALRHVPGSGLGILRSDSPNERSSQFARLPARVRALAREPFLLNLTKANSRATVHRPSYLDYVGVKRFDADGRVTGERRFLGLYTTTGYRASPREVPILRRKYEAVLARAGFPPDSHNEKALIAILETHPRDELLQTSAEELFEVAMAILHLGERQRVRLLVRRDVFGRFLSCLVFVPRDRFNTENRRRIERILVESFDAASSDYATRISESSLVRLHYTLYIEPGRWPEYEAGEIEARIVAATRSWTDDLQEALAHEHGEEQGIALFHHYAEAFPAAYRADWVARAAPSDIRRLEALDGDEDLAMSLYHPLEEPPHVMRAKIFRAGSPLALSDMLPVFENLGVTVDDERPYEITPRDRPPVWIYDFGLEHSAGEELSPEAGRMFQEAFTRAWHGHAENDGYNRLVLSAQLSWREVAMLRAIARYLRQAGTTFSDQYVEEALVAHPPIAALLIELVRARFDPEHADAQAGERIAA
ncbi:MAG TPA: NAD-glutamate dehydrogenase, partial [Myxococcota bacterium]|nr:NAD-glutamate dehydrogenase [Myxococcota bacterium]